MEKKEVIVEVKHMNKNFGSTVALNDVSITVRRGEILGLIGENGSGKSTVTSIISGMQKADNGEMFYENKAWTPNSMIEALEHGIGMIVQETGTVPGITVAENIFLGEVNRFKTGKENGKFGFISRKKMFREAKEILESIGASHIEPDMMTGMLDLQDRKLIEIAKVMSKNPQMLVVDAWFAKCGQMAQTEGLEVILAVGNGSDFFGTGVQGTDIKIASVDAYASAYGEAMEAGMLDYLAGKFSASIGPIFAATYSAALGAPIRTEEGYALALDQGYWVATSYDQFSEFYAIDSSTEAPAYTKEMLDSLLGADYATFADFVSKYGFEDIKAMNN